MVLRFRAASVPRERFRLVTLVIADIIRPGGFDGKIERTLGFLGLTR